MNIRDLRSMTKMTQYQFSEYLEIPFRTIQNWEGGQRKCPAYLEKLIQYRLIKEGFAMTLIELNEGARKELVSGSLGEIVTWLKENKEEYEWQLDEDTNAIMPDLDNIETVEELQNELDKVDLDWWTLVLE